MTTQGIVGAIVGAVLGALLWALISWGTGYEIGFVAWAVGGLVGGGAAYMGGRGTQMGMACAGLALASILVGKIAAVHFSLDGELENIAAEFFTQDTYSEIRTDAVEFAKLKSRDEYAQFMIQRGYTAASRVEDVDAAELAEFEKQTVPDLRKFTATTPSYSEWAEEQTATFVVNARAEVSVMDAVKEGFGMLDIVFGLLGVVTAFRLGEGGAGSERPQRPTRTARRTRIQGPPGHRSDDDYEDYDDHGHHDGGHGDDGPRRGDAPVRRRRR